MPVSTDTEHLKLLAEQNQHQSWVDYGTVKPTHPLLDRYIACYTYSIGCLHEQQAKLITRAYPTVMTQLYFEFYGGLSEIRGEGHGFAQLNKSPSTANKQEPGVEIAKRTYIKLGLGQWFDIYQLASNRESRPIKNLKVDLYPITFYELFQYAPKELDGEDLQLADLLGQTTSTLMLEEMEGANTGQALITIVERYFLQHLWQQISNQRLEIRNLSPSDGSNHQTTSTKGFTPPLPNLRQSLSEQAQIYQKSERWLQKRYAEVYGMSYKQIQSNLRFKQTHQQLWQTLSKRHSINLTELAYRSGYFDQAHFIKDFKRYTGMTPGQYLKTNFDQQSQYLWYW
ncbi:MAG: helix-turn-helix transcriptional regulator [Candidatus Thiodiazotropha endolucinida]|nr:helix-turn-helix transcriptional regulator [Candidatus Thiodiazotropha sp. (ex Codakia orbicularis)]MCG8044346.1 helix-turn-helix transcriptional regulator [Candidatus Thiodiazotropha taylori]MCG8092290.1 helix-turn-helix transcriptional regulator [Candidatus Thiodiazotropha endolucinida]MCG8061297.1 helix-turn-helix transcriptional regulator [Candidatus Thiodiazotropha taylori]MCG8064564.1 helix-turn-helix transcriptional regulator [Candidatus Thiodiazotropha taylori]